MPEPTKRGSNSPLIVHLIGLEPAEALHQIERRAIDLNRINCRPTLEPRAPASSISSAPLPKGGSFLNHGPSRSASVWASPYCDVRRFDDRCPTSNLAFYQCCEWLLASPLFARNVAAEVGEALAYVLVIECLVECIRERVENRLRYALRRKQRPPRQRLKFRQASLYCSWNIW